MNRTIEILAPAGSYEGMKAAMNAGCDAVYIGGSSFGARAYANNLEEEVLLRAIDEAHIRDKKLYLTVNTLLKEKERVSELYSFLEKFYLQGLDAVIVQDVGVLHFIHQHFPELPIHASTQMTLTMAQGANQLKAYGVTRLVTSRELSLREIRTIRDNTDMEIETFVHGALCYCYSGQCLMSSMIGGRSGNRGRCAQPCRMPYQFYSEQKKLSSEQEKYLLSPKDINTISLIPELIEAGIDSFKIEGRMKRPEYTAAAAMLYRKYVDLYLEFGGEKYQHLCSGSEYKKDMTMLSDIYNRGGFSEGYAKMYNGKSMMSLYRPNHSGVPVGEVSGVKGSQVTISLKEAVNAQDILEIRHKEEEGYEFTVKDPHEAGEVLYTNVGRRPVLPAGESQNGNHKAKYQLSSEIHIGDRVYRTRNNALLDFLTSAYLNKDKQLGITGRLNARLGEKLKLTLVNKDSSVTVYGGDVSEAVKQPVTKEKLAEQLKKTGDTLYRFDELVIDSDDNIFIPVAWLNDLRREAIHQMEEKMTGQYRRSLPAAKQPDLSGANQSGLSDNRSDLPKTDFIQPEIKVQPIEGKKAYGISVSVQTEEQLEAALEFREISAIYADYDRFELHRLLEMADKAAGEKKHFYLSLPHICRLSVYERLEKDLYGIIKKASVTGFLVKNFEEIALLDSLPIEKGREKEVILNYNMYVYNKEAKEFWREKGISHFTAPVELNYQELKQLGIEDCDMMVYGYLPLMVSAQCLVESTQGCRKCRQKHSGILTDRMGKKFYVQTNCLGCYNTIYNGQALSLHKQTAEISKLNPVNIRLDFNVEKAEQVQHVLKMYIELFYYGKNTIEQMSDYTTGHFKRGVE